MMLSRRDNSKKYSLLKTSWTYQTRQFFENSTLHGVRYIDEGGRPFCEKFLWFCMTAVGGVVTLIIIVSLWEKFQTNPTITGLDTDFHNWDVAFPSISVCAVNPADEEAVDMTVKKRWPDAKEEDVKQLTGLLMALTNVSWSNMRNLKNFANQQKLIPADQNLADLVKDLYRPCNSILSLCLYKGIEIPCCTNTTTLNNDTSFTALLTEVGFCYTFNSRHIAAPPKNVNDTFKVKLIYETDEKWGLVFNFPKVRTENSIPYFNVYIQSNDEYPSVDVSPQHTWDGRISVISFGAKQTYTTDEARQLSIKQRRCVFPDEISLVTDNIYTYSACMTQCRMNKARDVCKCVPFFYKKIDGYKHCKMDGLMCIANNVDAVLDDVGCNCELGCMNSVYEVEKLVDKDADSFEVAFVSWPMVRYKREVLFGWVDLLVSFGGIAGLFLGFSLLSGVEVIYYFTMRACCMVYRNQDELDKLQKEYDDVEKPLIDLSLTPHFMRKAAKVGEQRVKNISYINVEPVNYNKNNFPRPPFNLEFLP